MAAAPVAGKGTFTLPPPLGDAQRTQPLLTEWVIDPDVLTDPAFVSAFEAEAPVAVRYMATFGMRDDRLGFAPTSNGLVVLADEKLLDGSLSDPALITTATPSVAIALPMPVPHRDQDIVIVTADPTAWDEVIPQGPIPPRAIAAPHRSETRWFVLDTVPGSGAHTDATLGGASEPQTLVIDPAVRGDLAWALARIFVDATGATWDVTNSAPSAVSG